MMRIRLVILVAALGLLATAQTGGWRYGFEAGVGVAVPAGKVSDLMGAAATFGGGLTVDRDALRVKAVVTYAQPSLQQANPFEVLDATGRDLQYNATRNVSNVALSLQAGYSVYRHGAVSVTPLVGARYSHLGWTLNDLEWSVNDDGHDVFTVSGSRSAGLHSWSWTVSVDVDVKVHSKFVDDKRYTSLVRVSPWVSGAGYRSGLPHGTGGAMLGVTVSYAGVLSGL